MANSGSRRAFLAGGAALFAGGTVGCLSRPTSGTYTLTEGFEDELHDWEPRTYLHPQHGSDEHLRATFRRSPAARTGEYGLSVFTEGDHDDGTAWIQRPMAIEADASYEAEFSVYAWNEAEYFTRSRYLVLYLGVDPPAVEEDFTRSDGDSATDDRGFEAPLDEHAGWKEFSFSWDVPALGTNTLYVAVGVNVVWESDQMNHVDDLTVTLTEQ